METENNWIRFMKSGKVADYLKYVDSCKEKELSVGITNEIHNRGLGNKRDAGWRE